ncbi:MAG: hypothetical protein QOJ97_554 [Solirubrobacteraceae bacterium]|jgi:hypothetical protein|nr:hypothetical protein [Solirubrobacteraceae bacterium]
MRFRPSRLVLAALIAIGALSVAAPAQAGPLVASATDCDAEVYEQPFLQWGDVANYVLAPDGTVEAGAAGWSLTGGAATGPGNEPYFVHGAGETRSLGLPGGSSGTTPSMCVGIEHPTLRLFARNSGSILSTLKVEVLFEDALGRAHFLPIGLVAGTSAWGPTLPMPIIVNLLALLPGERTAVAFRFTPQGAGGKWRIDDVYVDPYRSR